MATAYSITLFIHNLLRWAIMFAAFYTLFRLFNGWIKKQAWQTADGKSVLIFTILLDVQLLAGLLLYFVFSDLVKTAFSNMAIAMSNHILRFFTVEHSLLMVIAIVLGHIAGAAGKKNIPDQAKYKRAAILTAVAFLLLLAGIPWTTRPLIPGF